MDIALQEADGVMIYSGSAVVDYKNTTGLRPWGALNIPYVAIYTGNSDAEEN
jgi:fructan beta-fructosidase